MKTGLWQSEFGKGQGDNNAGLAPFQGKKAKKTLRGGGFFGTVWFWNND